MARRSKKDGVTVDTEQDAIDRGEVDGIEPTNEGSGKAGSIVKPKYAGRYKTHNDGLSEFIAKHCHAESGFDNAKFFDLCRANGIKEEHIEPFKPLLDDVKINGLQGRARMTLRNRLAAIVRKNDGKIKDRDGNEHDTDTAPIPRRAANTETSGSPTNVDEVSPEQEAA